MSSLGLIDHSSFATSERFDMTSNCNRGIHGNKNISRTNVTALRLDGSETADNTDDDELFESQTDRTQISQPEAASAMSDTRSASERHRAQAQAALPHIARKYEISPDLVKRLLALLKYELVIVCDDSGSMDTTVDGTSRTRWNELCDIVKIILEIGVIFDFNGVDIYFLNRGYLLRVKDPRVLDELFAEPPSGYTPLVPVLKHIFDLPSSKPGSDKKLLVFVATDGAPTDANDEENIPELEHLMLHVRRACTTFVHFLVCTDDPMYVSYLNGWDLNMSHVDVTDDFHTEREKVRRVKGPNYRFSKGDYVVKALLGPIDRDIDIINDVPPSPMFEHGSSD